MHTHRRLSTVLASSALALSTLAAGPALAAGTSSTGVDTPAPVLTDKCPTGNEYARHGIRAHDYQAVVSHAAGCRYRLHYVDGYDVKGHTYYNAIFRPNGGAWSARHGLDAKSYQAVHDQHVRAGYRPVHVESSQNGPAVRYAVIYDKSAGSWHAYHGLTAAAHQKRFDALKQAGYYPKVVSVVSVRGQLQYTALWQKGAYGSWVLKSQIPVEQYQKHFDNERRSGRHLASLQAYRHDGKVFFAAVFSSAVPAGPAVHGATSSRYDQLRNTYTGRGWRTAFVTGYEAAGNHRYAAGWKP